jgi:hypothetical protein
MSWFQEVKFQEIESHMFKEIEIMTRRSKVVFFRRSKVSIIFADLLIMRLTHFDIFQEIES